MPEPSLVVRETEPRPVAARRLAYLDNLKVVMVAGVIAGHGIAGYAGLNWAYADVAEGEMGELSQAVFGLLILPFAVFVMALFFMVAGLLTPGSTRPQGSWTLRPGSSRATRYPARRVHVRPMAPDDLRAVPCRGPRLEPVGCVRG